MKKLLLLVLLQTPFSIFSTNLSSKLSSNAEKLSYALSKSDPNLSKIIQPFLPASYKFESEIINYTTVKKLLKQIAIKEARNSKLELQNDDRMPTIVKLYKLKEQNDKYLELIINEQDHKAILIDHTNTLGATPTVYMISTNDIKACERAFANKADTINNKNSWYKKLAAFLGLSALVALGEYQMGEYQNNQN